MESMTYIELHGACIAIRCDDSIPNEDVKWLAAMLEDAIRDGAIYRSGDVVQIGWMVNTLLPWKDKALALMEPDMSSFPIKWIPGVTHTLRHLRRQKDTAESLGLDNEIKFPSIRESGLLGVDVEAHTNGIILERAEAGENDSGWFAGSLHSRLDYNDPCNLRRCSLYEIAIACPSIVSFVALPVGTRIELSGGGVLISKDGSEVAARAGSFLELLLRACTF